MGMRIFANTFGDLAAFRIAAAYSNAASLFFTGDDMPDYRNEEVQLDVKGGGF